MLNSFNAINWSMKEIFKNCYKCYFLNISVYRSYLVTAISSLYKPVLRNTLVCLCDNI